MVSISDHKNRHYLYNAWGIYNMTKIIGSYIKYPAVSIPMFLFLIIINQSLYLKNIVFSIIIKNIKHFSINEFIFVAFGKY